MSKAAFYSPLIMGILAFSLFMPLYHNTAMAQFLGQSRVNVKVLDGSGWYGIPGAEIYIIYTPNGVECECYMPVTTDSSGEAQIIFSGVPPTAIQVGLEVRVIGYEPVRQMVWIVAFATVDIVIMLRQMLNVGGSGNGSGRVTSFPSGIDCNIIKGVAKGDCSHSYDFETVVTLTAVSLGGSKFKRWKGGCVGIIPECTLTTNSFINVSAEFYSFPWAIFLPTITKNEQP